MEVIILRICKTIRAMVCCIFMLLLMTTAFAETKINDSIVNDGQEQRYSIISGYDVALSKNGSTATDGFAAQQEQARFTSNLNFRKKTGQVTRR